MEEGTSAAFGERLVRNVVTYLENTYGDDLEMVEGQEYERDTEPKGKKRKTGKETIGDIDLTIKCENESVALVQIFPVESAWTPRPDDDLYFREAHIELKRGANELDITRKCRRFVDFYTEIYQNCELLEIDENCAAIFAYNNVERLLVVKEMKRALGLNASAKDDDMIIEGTHQVYVVWIDSDAVASREAQAQLEFTEQRLKATTAYLRRHNKLSKEEIEDICTGKLK